MEKENFDNYIVFLLGADSFKICNTIRTLTASFGMDTIYEKCKIIAQKFEKYDKQNINISQYDNFCEFVTKYENDIEDFLMDNKNFDINEEK